MRPFSTDPCTECGHHWHGLTCEEPNMREFPVRRCGCPSQWTPPMTGDPDNA